jgi:hypothetical protein
MPQKLNYDTVLPLQNILVAKYIRIRAQKKAADKAKELDEESDPRDPRSMLKRQNSKKFGRGRSDVTGDESLHSLKTEKTNNSRRGKPTSRKGKRLLKEEELLEKERPPFSMEWHSQSTSKKVQPRAVVIPYCRLKKDRFFDWPPDPTVSRATPVIFEQPLYTNDAESLTDSVREPLVEDLLVEAPQSISLRRRKKASESHEDHIIPSNITF